MSKIEKITPQTAALYLGAKCDVEWLYTDTINGAFEKGDVFHDSKISAAHASGIERGEIAITPHLRRLDSITEEEAREIYKISKGEPWEARMEWMDEDDEDRSALRNYWNNTDEWYTDEKNMEIGRPRVWLYLLSKGFDLFGLIESGLAKEIKNETVNS